MSDRNEVVAAGEVVVDAVVAIQDNPPTDTPDTTAATKPDGWAICQQLLGSQEVIAVYPFCLARRGTGKDGQVVGVRVKVHGLTAFLPQGNMPRGVKADKVNFRTPIDVVVIKCDQATKDLVVSAQAAVDQRVTAAIAQLEIGQDVTGVIGAVLEKSALVHLDAPYEGVTGAVPAGEIAGDRDARPCDLVKTGEKVVVRVLRPNAAEKKVLLSISRPKNDEELRALQPDQEVTGKVVSIMEYGYFIKIGGVSGLLPLSQIPDGDEGKPVYSEGETVTARILDVNVDERKFALSQYAPGERERRQPRPGQDRAPRGGNNFRGQPSRREEPEHAEQVVETAPVPVQPVVERKPRREPKPGNPAAGVKRGKTVNFTNFGDLQAHMAAQQGGGEVSTPTTGEAPAGSGEVTADPTASEQPNVG